ncbi:MAG: helix-turn-helix domain-containing protein [Kibdelosporangium sp.]
MAQNVRGQAVLLDQAGHPVNAFPGTRDDLLAEVAGEIVRVRAGKARSAVVDRDDQVVAVLPVGPLPVGPVLVVSGDSGLVADASESLADATTLLWMCWQVGAANRDRRRVARADSQAREAVLHLLMLGNRGGAGRVAAALGAPLPDPLRVLVVAYRPRAGTRDALVEQCAEIGDDQAWVVPCPVYVQHVIVLVAAGPVEERFRAFAIGRDDVHVGASQVVSLRETAAGYEQAFHALAETRSSTARYARFSPRDELAALLGQTGRTWAEAVLAPLAGHVPERARDPDGPELKDTLRSWLVFQNLAAKQLKVHRNTVAARLRLVERLLDCDVREIGTQATLHLAFRVLGCPPSVGREPPPDSMDALLRSAAVEHWALQQLAPLRTGDASPLLTTLVTWLDNNANVDATATALEISAPGVRKRLLRIEGVLRRSLVHGPSARYDLWLALRIHNGQYW